MSGSDLCFRCDHYRQSVETAKRRAAEFEATLPGTDTCQNCQRELWPERKEAGGRYCSQRCYKGMIAATLKFKLTEAEVCDLWGRQNCDACGKPAAQRFEERTSSKGKSSMAIDHNHTTGRVRGYLHNQCNSGIGMAGDDIETLWGWSVYLARDQFDLRDHCQPQFGSTKPNVTLAAA